MLNDNDNKMLFLKTSNKNSHDKIYFENEQFMLDHEVTTTEKEGRRSRIVDSIVTPKKMECADFVKEVETRVIDSIIQNASTCDSDLLFNKTEEHRSEEKDNEEAIMIGNLAEMMDLEGKLYQFKISIGS